MVFDSLGFLRNHIAKEQDLIDEERIDLLWVTDFPMFSLEDDGYKAMHHPFTSPKLNSLEDLKDPKKLKADAYDIVLKRYQLILYRLNSTLNLFKKMSFGNLMTLTISITEKRKDLIS